MINVNFTVELDHTRNVSVQQRWEQSEHLVLEERQQADTEGRVLRTNRPLVLDPGGQMQLQRHGDGRLWKLWRLQLLRRL